jgi:hypothetical protein
VTAKAYADVRSASFSSRYTGPKNRTLSGDQGLRYRGELSLPRPKVWPGEEQVELFSGSAPAAKRKPLSEGCPGPCERRLSVPRRGLVSSGASSVPLEPLR